MMKRTENRHMPRNGWLMLGFALLIACACFMLGIAPSDAPSPGFAYCSWVASGSTDAGDFLAPIAEPTPSGAPPPNGVEPAVIIGDDDRVRIENTEAFPWSAIAQLQVSFPGIMDDGICTGWFIGPHTVATNGHCLYDHNDDLGWADSITVTPGRNGSTAPYGSQTVSTSALYPAPRWRDFGDHDYDYGVIILPDDTLGNQVGWFDYGYYSDQFLSNISVAHLAGYPTDKRELACPLGGCQLWYDAGPITTVWPRMVSFEVDTEPGQSGAPVWFFDGSYRVVAIYQGHTPQGVNLGTRITRDAAEYFQNWGAGSPWHTDCIYMLSTYVDPESSGWITRSPEHSSGCPDGWYASGTTVNLTANPSAGYQFSSWSGAKNNNVNPTTVTIYENSIVTANFSPGYSCDPPSNAVALFWNADYDCGGYDFVYRMITGLQDVPGWFDDKASSVRVPSGWSVRLYEHPGGGGGSTCRSADDNNFAGDTFNNGVVLNDQVSSFEVFEYPGCPSGPGPGDQVPDPPSPLSASPGFETLIHLSWTDVSNENGYRIYRNGSLIDQLGPNVTTYPDSGVSCGITYSYYVTAYNNYGESGHSNTVSATPDCPSSGMTLCSDHNFTGTCKTFTSDDPNLHDDGLGGAVSSIRLHGNYCVHLYDNTDYQGQEGIFNYDVLNLEDHGWNDRAESVRIRSCDPPTCWVTLYADSYYGGGYKTFYSDDHDLHNDGLGNGVESLRLDSDCIVDLYDNTNYQGQRGTFEQDVPDLNPHNWGNRAESFQLRPKPPPAPSANAVSPWQINLSWTDNSNNEDGFRIYRGGFVIASLSAGTTSYEDTELSCGTSYSYYVKAFSGAGESGESNTASVSTHSCPTYGVTLCEHAFYRGICKTFESDDPDLSNDGLSENVSSLKVYGYCIAELYDYPSYGGEVEIFEQNSSNLHSYGWGDRARSIRVHSSDTSPPDVEVVSPAEASYLTSDSVTIYANISDSQSGVSGAQFFAGYDDGSGWDWDYVGSDTDGSDGWSTQWDASGVSDQTELGFYALAWDNADNQGGDGNYLVTLDRMPPSSSVNALPSTEGSEPFTVSWSGWDSTAGIASYDVQYKEAGWRGWYDWVAGTTSTSTAFEDARDGHTYYFRCRARDNAGHLEDYPTDADIYTTLQTCGIPSADAYEQDDSHTASKWIQLWQTQRHNLHDVGDQDWVKFQATAGEAYTIWTTLIDADCDTYIFLYGRDGTTMLDENDDIDLGVNLASRIEDWIAPADGTYYLMVRHWNEHVGGCGTTYDLSIWNVKTRIYIPLVVRGYYASASALGEPEPTATPFPKVLPPSTPTPESYPTPEESENVESG
jgi:glutamyl endopeptidase